MSRVDIDCWLRDHKVLSNVQFWVSVQCAQGWNYGHRGHKIVSPLCTGFKIKLYTKYTQGVHKVYTKYTLYLYTPHSPLCRVQSIHCPPQLLFHSMAFETMEKYRRTLRQLQIQVNCALLSRSIVTSDPL